MSIVTGCIIGFVAWFLVRYLVAGLYTVNQNERAVKTSFGRAQRISNLTTLDDPISESLNADEKSRYVYPQVRVIMPDGQARITMVPEKGELLGELLAASSAKETPPPRSG
jgi:regulator of protease activity HflC (stomatin/prohibitin superfamily)